MALLAAGSLGSYGSLIYLVPIVALYFLMIVPNQRKQKAWNQMLSAIKAGDKVTTNAGIKGTIVQVKDDSLIIRTSPDGIKLEFVKSAIAAVTTDESVEKK